jgi:nucleoid DNA-binding protein
MSEKAVVQLAEELGITVEQANAVWLKARQAMFKTLYRGDAVDLGFAYLMPTQKAARKRHDFSVNASVTVPPQTTLKMTVPPHVQEALAGKTMLSPYVFLTRSQLKNLPIHELDTMKANRLDYYRLKGVTV